MTPESKAKTPYREIAGILTAMMVVLSFVGMGFVQIAVILYSGVQFTFDADFKTALLGLASMALGFLVGSQSDNKAPPRSAPLPDTLPPLPAALKDE